LLVPDVIDRHTEPIKGLEHLKATAIQVMLASKQVKILGVYQSP